MSPHQNNFDSLRLLLALTVLFSHCWALGLGSEATEPLVWWSGGGMSLSEIALSWFFVFSGYLIAQSWDRSTSTRSFLLKRVSRIYPGYLAAVAVCLWVVMPLVGRQGLPLGSPIETLWCLFNILRLRLLLRSEGFEHNPWPGVVDGPLWTIPFEFFCYLGVVVLGWATLLRRPRAVLSLYVAAVAFGIVVPAFDLGTSRVGWIVRVLGYVPDWAKLLPEFLAGTVAYCWRDHIRYDGRAAVVALIALLAAAPLPLGTEVVRPTVGAYLGLYLAFTSSWSWAGATRFGDLSYGVYLYGWPVQQLIMARAGGTMNPALLFVLALVPTVLAALASWHLVERRFLRRVRVAAVEGTTAATA